MGELILSRDQDVALVRRTVARDLLPEEFDLFVSMCRGWGLDPAKRQIYAIVYNKNEPAKRKVSYVTGIDGYRAIADRTGRYAPGPRTVEASADDASDDNPKGIVSATATVRKKVDGDWIEFHETAFWDEFVPLSPKKEKVDGRWTATGEYWPLDKTSNWYKMTRVMLSKCAEAQALRRAFPDDLGGLHVREEMDVVDARHVDITPSEQADEAGRAERRALVGDGWLVQWADNGPLDDVPRGQFADRVLEFIADSKRDGDWLSISNFEVRNRVTLKKLWAEDKDAAVHLKSFFDEARNAAATVAA